MMVKSADQEIYNHECFWQILPKIQPPLSFWGRFSSWFRIPAVPRGNFVLNNNQEFCDIEPVI